MRGFGFPLFAIAVVVLIVLFVPRAELSAQTRGWSEPIIISQTPNRSWFPDIAVDSLGNIHVIWCETTDVDPGSSTVQVEMEQVFYTVWNGQEWSDLNDIVPPDPDIIRNAIAVDRSGVLHLTFRHSNAAGAAALYHMQATGSSAWSAAAWSSPHIVNIRGNSYASDLAIDNQGTIHLIFDDQGDPESEVCPNCADIFYRRSEDNGQTWSAAINLSQSPTGSSRSQIELDNAGVIHVTWDEGWDRLTGQGEPISGTYTFSMDAGETWAPPLSIAYPITETAQLTPASDGRGGVMLAWRTVPSQTLYYQWSPDAGTTWSEPATIPGILARPWVHEFDMYDMAADSAGHIHLVVVGSDDISNDPLRSDAPLGVYDLEWDGSSWLPPEKIFEQEGLYPEYPKVVVSEGNRLNVVWFTRDDPWLGEIYQVWFSSGRSMAPWQAPLPTFTPTPSPTPQPPPQPTPTATPLFDADTLQQPSSGRLDARDLYTDSDDIVQLVIALSPLALVTAGILLLRRRGFRR